MVFVVMRGRPGRRIERLPSTTRMARTGEMRHLHAIILALMLLWLGLLALPVASSPAEGAPLGLTPSGVRPGVQEETTSTVQMDGFNQKCAILTDVSGSTADYPETRRWFISHLEELLTAYEPLGPLLDIAVIAYGEEARLVYSGPGPSNPGIVTADLVAAVIASMRGKEWTNPMSAFQEATKLESMACIVHLTDGSLDLPPTISGDKAAYVAILLSLADDLGRKGVPVLTVAMSDASGDLWGEVARRTGGAYLVDPDQEMLRRTLAAFLPAPSPSATATPTLAPTPTSRRVQTPVPTVTAAPPPSAGSRSNGGFTGCSLIWMVGVPGLLVCLTVALVLRWKLGRPRLAGWIIIDEEGGNDARS
jgi:hypothetical protein